MQLSSEGVDRLARERRRVLARVDRVLLRGQSERIEPHRVQHLKAPHPLVAPDDVGRRVSLGVAHMQPASAGVREHVERVVLGPVRIETGLTRIRDAVVAPLRPDRLPSRLDLVGHFGGVAVVGCVGHGIAV